MRHKVENFQDIGMSDPFKPSSTLKKALSIVRSWDFYGEVYPNYIVGELMEAVRKDCNIKPPKTVFLPTRKLFRTMMRACVKYRKDNHYTFLMRFALVENNEQLLN